jgi:hypothetical protein
MAWIIWFRQNSQGRNVIKEWLKEERVPLEQIVKFQAKLDDFVRLGPELMAGFISDTPVAPNVYKMKIRGNKGAVQLRPMCSRGPASNEYTILLGTIEKDRKLHPKDWKNRAKSVLKELQEFPKRRTNERLI